MMSTVATSREAFTGTIQFERTFDMTLVREIVTEPRIYRNVRDDGSPARESFQAIDSPAIWYVLALDGEELLGMWMMHPHNFICYEVHTCLLRSAFFVPGRGDAAAAQFIEWVWRNTPCRRLITNVPDYNWAARRFAERAGMTQFGVNERSFQKDGRLYDQIELGISKPEVT